MSSPDVPRQTHSLQTRQADRWFSLPRSGRSSRWRRGHREKAPPRMVADGVPLGAGPESPCRSWHALWPWDDERKRGNYRSLVVREARAPTPPRWRGTHIGAVCQGPSIQSFGDGVIAPRWRKRSTGESARRRTSSWLANQGTPILVGVISVRRRRTAGHPCPAAVQRPARQVVSVGVPVSGVGAIPGGRRRTGRPPRAAASKPAFHRDCYAKGVCHFR